jgi:hypothetical protein
LIEADREPTQVQKRPALLRALGHGDPPEQVTVRARTYRRVSILKHDSWAATALYRNQEGEQIICKFNRTQPIFGIPMAWVGRILAAREAGFLRRLADIELVPNDLGGVVSEGRSLPNAIARSYVDGEAFRVKEQINPQFFDDLRGLLAAVHARDMAYVDLHKRENLIVGRDGRPYLIDFQVSLGLSHLWPGNGRLARLVVAKLQEIDVYHFNKHLARCVPETLTPEQRQQFQQPPGIISMHRKLAVPLRTLRRKLLVLLRVRDAGGLASSELESEDAYRQASRNYRTDDK